MLTKRDVIDLVNEQYCDVEPNETIACVVTIDNSNDVLIQQALLFNKELEGLKQKWQ